MPNPSLEEVANHISKAEFEQACGHSGMKDYTKGGKPINITQIADALHTNFRQDVAAAKENKAQIGA